MMIRIKNFLLQLFCTVFLSIDIAAAMPDIVTIGVLSHRGDNKTIAYWATTADYPSQEIPGNEFRIIPLDFDEIEPNIQSKNIDFIDRKSVG